MAYPLTGALEWHYVIPSKDLRRDTACRLDELAISNPQSTFQQQAHAILEHSEGVSVWSPQWSWAERLNIFYRLWGGAIVRTCSLINLNRDMFKPFRSHTRLLG